MVSTGLATQSPSTADIQTHFRWQRSLSTCVRLIDLSSTEDFIGVGDCLLQLSTREIFTPRGRSRLQEKPFTLLLALIEQGNRLVTRDALYERLWVGVSVDYQYGLDTVVKKLRHALGESRSRFKYIETLPRNGYRLLVPVQRDPNQIKTIRRSLGSEQISYDFSLLQDLHEPAVEQLLRSAYEQLAADGAAATREALKSVEQAVQVSQGDHRSFSLLSLAWVLAGLSGSVTPAIASSNAKSAALQALRARSIDSLPLCVLSFSRAMYDYDLAGAARDSQELVGETNIGWHSYLLRVYLLLAIGKTTSAYQVISAACELYPQAQRLSSLALLCARFSHQPGASPGESVAREPTADYNFFYGQLLIARGMFPEAIACLRSASEAMEDNSAAQAMIGVALVRTGLIAQAQQIDETLDALGARQYTDTYHRSILKAALGMTDAALNLLEQARDDRSPWFALSQADPNLDALRNDPRFTRLTRSLIL